MDDDAVADEGLAFVVNNSGRQEMKVEGDAVHNHRVSRVVPAL